MSAKQLGEDLREDFPVLNRLINEQPITYLDSAATSLTPLSVINAISSYYSDHRASIHRGVYKLAEEATELFEGARERVAEFAGSSFAETIFTRNATEAINLVAYSWGRRNLKPGDIILITEMEHHSNIVPWQLVAQDTGAKLEYVNVAEDGQLDLTVLERKLASGQVKLLAFTHVSNVLGTINPVSEITAQARAAGVTTLVDGSQAAPQLPINVNELGADFYVWTGHKVLGPTGIGVLHGRQELLESMPPFISGGDMIKRVDFTTSTWNDLPWKFEAGTSMIAEGIGLGAAIDYLTDLGMSNVHAYKEALTQYALEKLAEIEQIRIIGPPTVNSRGGLISFEVNGVHPHDVAELLNRDNVCVRAGHHCAQPLMRKLGIPATARASFGVYTTRSDIDALIKALHGVCNTFRL